MEIIERVIFNNLVRQQSVMLPKVGVLMVYKEAGRFDAQARRVIAPRLRVEFITETPDGYPTIIDLMMREGAQRQEDVKTLYEHWVENNCKKSDKGIKIGEVGYARLVENNSYAFEASPELQELLNPLDNYSIELQPVKSQPKEEQPRSTTTAPKPSKKRKSQNVAIVLILLALLGGWIAFDQEIFSGGEQQTKQAPQPQTQSEKQTPQQKAHDEKQQSVDTVAVSKSDSLPQAKADSTAAKPAEKIENKGRFCIIGGLYSVEANADKLIEDLGENGKYAEKLPARNNRMYVSIRRFETRAEAERFINQNHRKHPDYWILEIQNNQQ